MAALFSEVNARYVVLTTKHHDGFTLWQSDFPCPHKESYHAQRDVVGDLTEAVRDHGMRMALYYSGGLDWAFNESRIDDGPDVWGTIVQTPEFVEYSLAHWRELIDRYQPSIMWNDIGYPAAADLGRTLRLLLQQRSRRSDQRSLHAGAPIPYRRKANL